MGISSRYLSGQFTLPVFKSKTKLLVKMKYFLMTSAVVLSFLYVGAEASPKLPGNKRDARGYDYDYYNPYATMFQKRGGAQGFDYDYYNPYATMYQKRNIYRPYLRFVKILEECGRILTEILSGAAPCVYHSG